MSERKAPDAESEAQRLLANDPVWLNGLVVSALEIRARWRRFDSRVTPLLHWVATWGKLFSHIASAVSQLQETVGVFGAWVITVVKCARLS